MLTKFSPSVFLLLILLSPIFSPSQAQDSGNLSLSLVEERKIGTDCPQASALAPSGTFIWVLMDNCFEKERYFLRFTLGTDGFDFDANGGEDYGSSLQGLDNIFIDGLLTSVLSVGVDGSPQLIMSNADGSIQSFNPNASVSRDNSALEESLSGVAVYPEFSAFNADHSLVAANGTDGVHILDTSTGAEVLTIEIEGGTDSVLPQFSSDGQSIDLVILNNPDDPNASSSTLYRYSIPDGELQLELDLLSFLAWISPNGQYVLLWMGDDELVVIEVATGGISNSLNMFEENQQVLECANEDGFSRESLAEAPLFWDGFLPPMGIHWLPDSSGFVTLNSYTGASGLSDNAICKFSESRLRRYSVSQGN